MRAADRSNIDEVRRCLLDLNLRVHEAIAGKLEVDTMASLALVDGTLALLLLEDELEAAERRAEKPEATDGTH